MCIHSNLLRFARWFIISTGIFHLTGAHTLPGTELNSFVFIVQIRNTRIKINKIEIIFLRMKSCQKKISIYALLFLVLVACIVQFH